MHICTNDIREECGGSRVNIRLEIFKMSIPNTLLNKKFEQKLIKTKNRKIISHNKMMHIP